MLVGGNGGDVLVSGGAPDIFLYRATTESPYVAGNPVAVDTANNTTILKTNPNAWDIIVGFNSSKDTIDLSLLDKQLSGPGPTKLVWLANGAETDAQSGQASASHVHGVWTDSTGNFLYADTNGDGAADLKIQVHGVVSGDLVGVDNAPVVTSGNFTGSVTEIAGVTNSLLTDSTGGAIKFTDADTADTHTVTYQPEGSNYVGTFMFPAKSFADSTGGATGSQGWSFSVTDKDIDFLGAGEHLTQKYDVTVTDNWGASVTQVVTVTINGSIDTPTLSASAAHGTIDEGGSVGLNISTSDVDNNANLSVSIGGVPLDAQLSAGHDNYDGSWTLTAGQLSALTLTPDSEFSGPIHLTVGVTNTEGAVTASAAPQSIDINVVSTAEAPNLSAQAATVDEGGTVGLSISASAAEPDQNAPSIAISGLGNDTLNHGHNNGDGSYTLTTADLSGLTLTVGGEESGPLSLTVMATDTEADTTASSTATLAVTIHATAEAPNLSAPTSLSGNAGLPILLNIAASHVETDQHDPTVTITGLPTGATLTDANHDTLTVTNGGIMLTESELNGLALTDSSVASGTLHVAATDTEFDTSKSSSTDISYSITSPDSVNANNDHLILSEGLTNLDITKMLLANDTVNPVGTNFHISGIDTSTLASGFTAALDPTTHDVSITVNANFPQNGSIAPDTSFSYTLTDANNDTSTATVTITAYNVTNGTNTVNLTGLTYNASYIDALGGNDAVTGGSGTNTFLGGDGNDTLTGGPGNNTLVGGLGADILTGGGTSDNFVYKAVTDSSNTANGAKGVDTITDFSSSHDTFDFSGLGTTGSDITTYEGQLANTGTNVAAHSIGWIESGGNTIVYANTSVAAETQAHADMMIILTGVNLGLTTSDFHLHA